MNDVQAFMRALDDMARSQSEAMMRVADALGAPYHPELECDGPRGPRVERWANGRLTGSSPGPLLPGSADNSPDCYLNVPKALEKMRGDILVGIYFHRPSLNLVLMGLSGVKVGIRLIDLQGQIPVLVEALAKQKAARGNS